MKRLSPKRLREIAADLDHYLEHMGGLTLDSDGLTVIAACETKRAAQFVFDYPDHVADLIGHIEAAS